MSFRKVFITGLIPILFIGCGGGGGSASTPTDDSGSNALLQKIRDAAAAIAAMQVVNNVNN